MRLDVTAGEVRAAMIANEIDHVDHHPCSMCGYMTHYLRVGEDISFDPGCYCMSGDRRQSSFDEIAHWINMQSRPDIKAQLAARCGLLVGEPPSDNAVARSATSQHEPSTREKASS